MADALEDGFGLTFEAAMAHATDPELARGARLALLHRMMGTLLAKTDWFATMERAGVPMFNDAEEMAAAAGLLPRYPALRNAADRDLSISVTIRDRVNP